MLSSRAQVAVAGGFAVLVLATLALAVYLLTGLGSGSAREDDDAAAETVPVGRDDGARATCRAFADALEPVVPLLTPVAPTENDPARGQAVQGFLQATEGVELEGWFDRYRVVLAGRMGLLAFEPDDDAQYAQRYADYLAAWEEVADACRVQEVPMPQPVPA